jgi:hypothetical protein
LGPPLGAWWQDLGDATFTPKVRADAVAGVTEEHDLSRLIAERDDILITLLELKSKPEQLP